MTATTSKNATLHPDPHWARLLPYHIAKSRGIVVIQKNDNGFDVVVREGTSPLNLAEARRVIGAPLQPRFLSPAEFEHCLGQAYARGDNQAAQLMDDLSQDVDLQQLVQDLPIIADLLEMEDDAPIIRLINAVLTQALRESASDIHIEAFETRSVIRFRVDGILRDILEPQRSLHAAIVSRIKIMASLDIAEKRLPQDGRITLRLGGRPVDVRVSTLPSAHGERVVLRLLDKQAGRLELKKLGMSTDTLQELDRLIHQPHGIMLVTGPTGSGKTTTLYAALSQLDTKLLNIMTVEDPIEYDLDGVAQTQVNPRIEMTFARALRSILRQDPDIVMIGEIRDLETAQIAVQASLTGHLVLATLHTNDAPSAVTRLIDMGVEPYLLASSMLGIVAQRLVRRLCPECHKPYQPSAGEIEKLKLATLPSDTRFYAAQGCPACNFSGYQGRTGIYELLSIDEPLRHMIHDGSTEQAMREYAQNHGMVNLRQDSARYVVSGETTIEETLRVTKD
ncbi:MAG: type II secretion system ATPase GspE [Gammaproteobacteria bacterium]|nr:type II secretion system ATPase GspE [Gammaproteobacteria bacterium]MBU1732745.1 type II secretion system ATPase GspE [Gammaproteobacteria bacterium]MBU1891570.1 type II secretion system ATPase GspE [Gammaproteobacteria bacterium]